MLWCLRTTVFYVFKVSNAVSNAVVIYHAYFQAMLILRCHSFGKCLFLSHAYFRNSAYYREFTVNQIVRASLRALDNRLEKGPSCSYMFPSYLQFETNFGKIYSLIISWAQGKRNLCLVEIIAICMARGRSLINHKISS